MIRGSAKSIPNKLALCRQIDYCCQCSKVCFFYMLYILRTKVREKRVWYKREGDSEKLVSYYEESGIEGRGTPWGWVLIARCGY